MKRLPSPPSHTPAVAFPFFGDAEGGLPSASPAAAGTLSVLLGFPEAAGEEPWASSRCLPAPAPTAPPGKPAAPSSPQRGLCSPGAPRTPLSQRVLTPGETESGNILGKSQTRQSPGAPPSPARPPAIGPRRPRPFDGRGHAGARELVERGSRTRTRRPLAPPPWPACPCGVSCWAAG